MFKLNHFFYHANPNFTICKVIPKWCSCHTMTNISQTTVRSFQNLFLILSSRLHCSRFSTLRYNPCPEVVLASSAFSSSTPLFPCWNLWFLLNGSITDTSSLLLLVSLFLFLFFFYLIRILYYGVTMCQDNYDPELEPSPNMGITISLTWKLYIYNNKQLIKIYNILLHSYLNWKIKGSSEFQ